MTRSFQRSHRLKSICIIRKVLAASVLLLFFRADLFSQDARIKLFIGGGYSFNGSGDAGGYAFTNQVDIKLSRRLFLSPGVQLTNHFEPLYIADYQFHNITTGINVYANLNCLLLNSRKHQVAIGAGPVGRFQSTTQPTTISYGSSPTSNNPRLFVDYQGSVHSLALGYNVSPSYSFRISPKLALSAKVCLQNDTQADLITSEMLLLGISL